MPPDCLSIIQRRAAFPVSLAKQHLSSHPVHDERDCSSSEITNSLESEDQVGHWCKAPEGCRVYVKGGIKSMNIIKDTFEIKLKDGCVYFYFLNI